MYMYCKYQLLAKTCSIGKVYFSNMITSCYCTQCLRTIDWIRSEGHTGVVRHLQADSWKIVSAADDKTLKVRDSYSPPPSLPPFLLSVFVHLLVCLFIIHLIHSISSPIFLPYFILYPSTTPPPGLSSGVECTQGRAVAHPPVPH